jgi:hypothetical protein
VAHPIADHKIGALVKFRNEARDIAEVIRKVGVGHDDVIATRCTEACVVRVTVPSLDLVDHGRPSSSGEIATAVSGAVVYDDDFTGDVRFIEHLASAAYALLDRLCLVQARNYHRDAWTLAAQSLSPVAA